MPRGSSRRTRWLTASATAGLAIAVLWLASPPRAPEADLILERADPTAVAEVIAERGGAAGPPAVSTGPPASVGLGAESRDPTRRRTYLTEEHARKLFLTNDNGRIYDPWTFTRFPGGIELEKAWEEHPGGKYTKRTNSDGLPDDEIEWHAARDLRVLVAGDSHTFGLCSPEETYPHLLEVGLCERWPARSFDVLNAAQGGFSLYEFLGTLEKFLPWEPDVFVLGVFAGNDFDGTLDLAHLFEGGPALGTPPEVPGQEALGDGLVNALAQCYLATLRFQTSPEAERRAVELAVDLVGQMQAICEPRGIHVAVVLIPAPCWLAWDERPAIFDQIESLAGLDGEDCGATARVAAGFLDGVRGLGVAALDLTPVFARLDEPPYWRRDYHLDLAGHRAAARELLELVSTWCVERGRLPPRD
jgi:hypothetical protein